MSQTSQIYQIVPSAKWKYQNSVIVNIIKATYPSPSTNPDPSSANVNVILGIICGTKRFSGNSNDQNVDLGKMSIFYLATLQTIYLELIKLNTGHISIVTQPQLLQAQLEKAKTIKNMFKYKTRGNKPLTTQILGLVSVCLIALITPCVKVANELIVIANTCKARMLQSYINGIPKSPKVILQSRWDVIALMRMRPAVHH